MVDGGDSPTSAPDPPGGPAPQLFTDAPILLLVLFHNAMRAEFVEIRRVVSGALESGSCGRDLVVEVHRRFEFLKLAYKYHCAAEDEVIFFALDAHINNVACTYSLEHKSIDGLFDSVFNSLNVLMEDDDYLCKPLQELVSCIGTLQTAVCKHMMKEEKQVFPLLMQQFSSIEQASLVWRFMCSVPITLLMDVLPWMTSFLSPNEQADVLRCMKEVIPKEKLLQEVVISWLANKRRPSFGAYTENGEGAQCHDGLAKSKDVPEEHPIKSFAGIWKKAYFLQPNIALSPVDGVPLWHGAIRKDLKEILEELYQIRSSNNYTDLASVIVQLKFLADVLTFYSNALDKLFYPVLKEVANSRLSFSSGCFFSESQIEGLQRSLYYNSKNGIPLCKFVENLCREVESFMKGITKQFAFQEREVFPLVSENCNHEMQQQLLYMSLHTMPLGLLKCVITWFSGHLSEDQSMSILGSIKQGCPLDSKSFASLLLEWVRMGYSGKTSVEKFRKDLQNMFETKCFFLSDQIKKDTGSSSVHLDAQPCNRSSPGSMDSILVDKAKNIESISSFGSQTSEMHATLYSSGINMHIFFPGTLEILCPFPKIPGEETNGDSILQLEPRPMDHIFLFHKALKKDLEYLVFGSTQLAENVGLLIDFRQRFNLVQFLYQIHSDAEDEIAFPALEAKENKGQNISNSYTMDHKIEADHFNDISLILDEMSEVHTSLSADNADKLDQKMLKYHQLCIKLHDMCKTMHKILCDHIHHEEIELWPLFRECFSIQEQEKIIGYMLGRTRAETLQDMIPWLMAYLTPEEQQSMISLWRKATKNTMFDEWLREWWVDMRRYDIVNTKEELSTLPSSTTDPLEIISTYLPKESNCDQGGGLFDKGVKYSQKNSVGADIEKSGNHNEHYKAKVPDGDEDKHQCSECAELFREGEKNRSKNITAHIEKPGQRLQVSQKLKHQDQLLSLSQEDLEATIIRVSRDSSLDSQKKSYLIQNLLTSRWIVTQQISSEATILNADEITGRFPSYRDPINLTFGCEHYKRNCKLLAACCSQLYACRNCHDDAADHSMDRKATTKMMCMKCLIIQPIGPTCSTASCGNISMAKYYCKICKLFDDERDIYHCPYCNLCRVGKGLGIDYFHCMNCNACMSRSLSVHVCREKSFEDNCPICHEDIFTSSSPVKALPCGHMMHSACFQDYTCTHYTCPMCSKSLGDMQVYFGMLDALLAEEKISDEYSGRTQVILCNDCEKRGTAPHHWLYHKCPYCGSYNTRIL